MLSSHKISGTELRCLDVHSKVGEYYLRVKTTSVCTEHTTDGKRLSTLLGSTRKEDHSSQTHMDQSQTKKKSNTIVFFFFSPSPRAPTTLLAW